MRLLDFLDFPTFRFHSSSLNIIFLVLMVTIANNLCKLISATFFWMYLSNFFEDYSQQGPDGDLKHYDSDKIMTIFYGGQQAFKDKILFFSTVVQYSKIGSKSGIRTGFERKNVDNFQAARHTDLRHLFKDKTNCHFSSRSLFKILIFSGQSTCRPRTVFLMMKF